MYASDFFLELTKWRTSKLLIVSKAYEDVYAEDYNIFQLLCLTSFLFPTLDQLGPENFRNSLTFFKKPLSAFSFIRLLDFLALY